MVFDYLNAADILADSLSLAKKIFDLGYRPTVAVSLWRGGTVIGLAVEEYFKMQGCGFYHTTVATASYGGLGVHGEVVIKNLESLTDHLTSEDILLIIDDIYDSGKTIDAMIKAIKTTTRRNAPKQIIVGCIHNKKRKRDFSYNVVTLYDVPEGTWLSYPHEIYELIGVNDGDKLALSVKSADVFDILNATHYNVENVAVKNDKLYLEPNKLLLDSFKLGVNIYNDEFIPNWIIAVWRDGVATGIAVHEYIKYKLSTQHIDTHLPDHIAINAVSANVEITKYLIDRINYDDKILLVTTVFDAQQIHNVTSSLKAKLKENINLENVKTASIYYNRSDSKNLNNIKPDYYIKNVDKEVINYYNISVLAPDEQNALLKKVKTQY